MLFYSTTGKSGYRYRFFTDFAIKEHGHLALRVILFYIFWVRDHISFKVQIIQHFYACINYLSALALGIANIQYNMRSLISRESITLKTYPFGSSKLGSNVVIIQQNFVI